jgi:hypothetical protein
MKRPSPHKFLLHGQGTGELTDDIVEDRAREIAAIHGRPADRPSEEDRAEAWAELQGELLPAATDTDGESVGAITRDPSEPVSVPGRHVPNRDSEDDSGNTERLASEGVEEASHDQMLAARRSEHRRDRR